MDSKPKGLSVFRNTKIAFFHLGSGMADVLTTGVWNRIMISDLGISATPVSLLVSLRYFLAPLGIWAGRMSDQHRILGFRRLAWIWFGRFLMVLSTFGLGFGTVQLLQHLDRHLWTDWLIIISSLIAFSIGNALSGSTFLALVYDRATEEQRGRAVGIVWTFLLLGFTVGGIVFSLLLPDNSEAAIASANGLSFTGADLWRLFVIAGSMFATFWFFSLLGEERRDNTPTDFVQEDNPPSLREDLKLVWENGAMRFFMFYLTLSMFFAFSQDPILEPFAGDVFNMEASLTNRFAAYWGSTSILTSLISLWLLRKVDGWNHTRLSQVGVVILIITFGLLTLSSFAQIEAIIMPGLLVLGIGLGFWNIGTLGLMMDMSPLGRAGTFLGFWSMLVTLSRGGGITSGGIGRDVGLWTSGDFGMAYALVFGVATAGLVVAYYCLMHIHVDEYKAEQAIEPDLSTMLATATD